MSPAVLADLPGDLRDLARLASTDDIDDLLRRGLEWLGRLAPYDLATIFVVQGDSLVVRAARGPLASRVPRGYTLPLDRFPTVREALETRHARAFTEADHRHGDGDPFDGLLDLPPGHSCMVVPLFNTDRAFGALTLDRNHCEVYPGSVVTLVEIYAWMLALALTNAEQRAALERLRNHDLERARLLEVELGAGPDETLDQSKSPLVRELARKARQVAETTTPVLLLGETGTGKEHLARAIHAWSPRAERPFVKINCAAIPPALLESELFGHVKGAFTGATRDRPGRFQVASGGTLLLDEIGELPLEVQAKLLRVLQEGTFEPVGSDHTSQADVRVIAATHVDLDKAIRERRFREDLYYRLSVFPLRLPPLRDRAEDLPRLGEALLAAQARRTGRQGMSLTPEALRKLAAYRWPGNIRELANILERSVILSPEDHIGPEAIDLPELATGTAALDGEVLTLDEAQRRHIRAVLARTSGRIYGKGGAAELLGMKPSTLQSRMKKLDVDA
jgi:transcriptional regulator with GAF, ATPase, and Fis domain